VQVALAINGVIGVLTLAIREQRRFGNLLVKSPLLVKEIGQVEDIDT
jgi:hypothetical protein